MQNKIYVGNLSYSLDETSIRKSFEGYGEITDLAFPKDRVTGRPRGFAFITFADENSAKNALELDGKDLSGRKVVVKFALERKATGSGGRRGGERSGESRW
jgi:RNA recognition motif-containing protein